MCDNFGDESDNEIIGRDRATNVMNHFISQGIATTKLKALGLTDDEITALINN